MHGQTKAPPAHARLPVTQKLCSIGRLFKARGFIFQIVCIRMRVGSKQFGFELGLRFLSCAGPIIRQWLDTTKLRAISSEWEFCETVARSRSSARPLFQITARFRSGVLQLLPAYAGRAEAKPFTCWNRPYYGCPHAKPSPHAPCFQPDNL